MDFKIHKIYGSFVLAIEFIFLPGLEVDFTVKLVATKSVAILVGNDVFTNSVETWSNTFLCTLDQICES